MNFTHRTILGLALSAAACALTSCGADNDQAHPTYTQARHMRTGSNVPQAPDIANASSVYTPAAGSEAIANNPAIPQGTGGR